MKQADFNLICKNVNGVYKYVALFREYVDAEQYVNEFGGVIESINCMSYKDFNESKIHIDSIKNANLALKELLSMTEEEKILFKHYNPEMIESLKQLL